MCREMHGLAYAMSLGERHVTRAVLMAPSVKICGFWTFFTIQVGAQKVIDFRRRDKRSFAEECAGFKIHRKRRLFLAITCCKSTGKHDIDKNWTLCRLHRATVKTLGSIQTKAIQ